MTDWPVLASLAPAERDELLRAGRRRRFAKGEVVFHHGDPADSLHLLDSGRVVVRVLTPQGEQAILTILGPGQVFGELALIDGHAHRTATITALQACETIVLRRRQFDKLRELHPQVNTFLLASLAAQVNRLSEHLLEVLFSPTPHRVQRRLLILADEFDGEPIAITQEELALMAGTTRTTVNEILRDLERRGTVRIGRGRLEVLDRAALARRIRG
jgi:CRP-like cAMP-binding protein